MPIDREFCVNLIPSLLANTVRKHLDPTNGVRA